MTTSFRRGFKKEVSELVAEIRSDFGIRPLDPIEPAALAGWLGIPVLGISTAGPEITGSFRSSTAWNRFHAATLPYRGGHLIVHNDLSPPMRQKSDLAHELGHIFLEHDFMPLQGSLEHRRSATENEADWFGFSLLITDEAALSLARANLTDDECARIMQVSEAAVTFRLNASGARTRAHRERNRRQH